jgi:radical SAM superfamily enzyme YgiQ (UPF0313 family)
MAHRTPAQIQHWLEENLHRMDLPVQWLGDEPNSIRKPWDTATVRWCLVASWPYEAAAGNQSIPAVYKAINNGRADFLADRCYLPATPRDLKLLEKAGIPIFGIESKHQLMDFDIVGTSIAYPVLSLSYVKLLTMSGIPLRWRQREAAGLHNFPMVIVGGQSYGAPEVLAPVVDCWWLGEVEDEPGNPGISAVCARITDFKATGRWATDRLSCYQDLAREFNFLYFPRFLDVHYHHEDRTHVGVGPHPSKQVVGYSSNLDGMRLPFTKRHVKDLDNITVLDDPPLLYADPAMGSGDLEIGRGCPAWCGFCALGWRTKPYRQMSVERAVVYAKAMQANMGSVRMAPFSPDFPMHTQRKKLISAILENVSDEVDAPAMRVDDFVADNEFILLQVHGGMDAVTLGVEGNSQRMRDLVGKGTADADIHEAVARGIRAGIRKFKLFMITNLPGEDEGDVYRILKLAKELADIRESMGQSNVQIQFSWTPLMVEANTPMQWFAPPAATRILSDVWEEFRDLKILFKIGAKALPLDAPVLTRNGFRRMGDIRTGDVVVDPDGQDSFVTGVYPQGFKPVYRLIFSDGSTAEATDDHLWAIERWSCRPVAPGKQKSYWKHEIVTTARLRQILTQSSYPPRLVAAPGLASTDLASYAPLPLDPYVLGLLLGDGTLTGSTPRFTTMDPELAAAIEAAAPVQAVQSTNPKDYTLSSGGNAWRSNPLNDALKAVGVWGCRSWEKFVPEQYKWASAKTRLAVLQGLMDTDGSGRDRRSSTFSSSSQQLRDDVVWLARSLGLIATALSPKRAFCAGKEGRTSYRCLIWETEAVRVFRLDRKIRPLARPKYRVLKAVEYLRDDECQCITVSAPSKLFVTSDFIPTHNSEENKMAFFQLCQRASREVGEALVDAMEAIDQACWGGVPRSFKDLIETRLHAWGFDNGYGDCFDERVKADMFGWEFIDQGVSAELLWVTYLQMREFLEQTDSHTYDLNYDSSYHGNEWISRCDERCYGKTCGACDHTDLRIRTRYLRAGLDERAIDLSTVKSVDQRSQAMRIRARVHRHESHRFVMNDHWRFALRRAAFRAQDRLGLTFGIAKRSIRFASDEIKYKDWTCGVDYVEFGLTRPMSATAVQQYLDAVNAELGEAMSIGAWATHPPSAATMRADVAASLFELELDAEAAAVLGKLARWNAETYIPMQLRIEGGYFAPASEEVNAKDYVDDLWLTKDGYRLKLRMLVRGRPSPYNIYAALMGRSSWLDAAKIPAVRLEAFVEADRSQQDFLRPNCAGCGLQIPTNILDEPYDPQHCPRCKDEHDGIVVHTTSYA